MNYKVFWYESDHLLPHTFPLFVHKPAGRILISDNIFLAVKTQPCSLSLFFTDVIVAGVGHSFRPLVHIEAPLVIF